MDVVLNRSFHTLLDLLLLLMVSQPSLSQCNCPNAYAQRKHGINKLAITNKVIGEKDDGNFVFIMDLGCSCWSF